MKSARLSSLGPDGRKSFPIVRTVLAFGLTAALLASCKSNTDAATTSGSGSSSTPISATIPPGYNGTLPAGAAAQTAPLDTSGIDESAPTSVLPENQPLCEAVSKNAGLF